MRAITRKYLVTVKIYDYNVPRTMYVWARSLGEAVERLKDYNIVNRDLRYKPHIKLIPLEVEA